MNWPTAQSICPAQLPAGPVQLGYTAYGYRWACQNSLGFHGVRLDSASGCYLLGNGRRAFSPSLMRFTTVDNLSPFAAGGLNAYAYCLGDPVNRMDPSGSVSLFKSLRQSFRRRAPERPASPRVRKMPDRLYSERIYYTKTYEGLDYPMQVVADSADVPRGYRLIGFHGTKTESSVQSLESGLNIDYAAGGLMGRGFYFTQSAELAKNFAGREGVIVGVYTKGLSRLVEGKDYSFFRRDVMVVYPRAYDKFIVRRDIVLPIRLSAESVRRPSDEPYAGRDWF